MTAPGKFDPDRGTRFVTYAAHWIRGLILDHVIRAHSLVGVGSGPLRSKVFFRSAPREGEDHGRHARHGARQRAAGLQVQRHAREDRCVERAAGSARSVSSSCRSATTVRETILDTLASTLPLQEERLASAERASKLSSCVRDAVKDLDPRERYIVETRIMADAHDELESWPRSVAAWAWSKSARASSRSAPGPS